MKRRRLDRITLLSAAALLLSAPALFAQDAADRAYRAATGLLNRDLNEAAAAEYRAFLDSAPQHPRAAHARYGLAVALTRLGQHEAAARELDALRAPADFEFAADAALLRARCAVAANDWRRAATALANHADHFEGSPTTDSALALLGESLYRSGDAARAARALQQHTERFPDSAARPRTEYLLALCEITTGDSARAAERLRSVRERSPNDPLTAPAALAEAQCRHRLGDTDAALTLYKLAASSADATVKPDALLGLAQLTRAAGRPAEARAALDTLLKEHASAPCASLARFERALALHDEGRFDAALRDLESLDSSAQAIGPDRLAAWSARCETRLEQWDAVVRRLDRAERRFDGSALLPDMLYDRAVAFERSGAAERAMREYAALARTNPDHPRSADALLALGALAYREGDFATSATAARALLDRHPDHLGANDAALLVAECAYLTDHFDDAERAYSAFIERAPQDPRAWRALVRRALALSRLDRAAEAEPLLDLALSAPHEPDPALEAAALTALAESAFAREDWPRAERHFTRLAALSTQPDAAALLRLALAVHRQDHADKAISAYDRAIAADPRSETARQARFERAQALVELGRLDDARKAFESIAQSEPRNADPAFAPHALRHLAAIASQQGRAADAAAYLDRLPDSDAGATLDRALMLLAAGNLAESEAMLARFIAAAPNDPRITEARVQRAAALNRLGKPKDALDALAPLNAPLSETAAYERAWALQSLGRADEARAAYRALLDAKPSPRFAVHGALELAQLDLGAERYDEALKSLDRAERSADDADDATRAALSARLGYLRGIALVRLERAADGAAALDAFLDANPDSALAPSAALLCAEALAKSGRPDGASARLRALLAKNPPDALARPALLRLGEACAGAQDWTGSEEAFAAFLRRFPDDELWFQARFGIGWARENAGRHDSAIEAYREVVERHEGATGARAQFQIGECLFALKKHDDAVRELLKVDILYDYPEWSAAALYEAGRCLAEQSKTAEAREQFKHVVARFGDTQWARLASEQLKSTRPEPLAGR